MINFKNTKEALLYAHSIKNNPKLIYELRLQRQYYIKKFTSLMKKRKLKEALYLASGQAQFTREALKESKIMINI